MELLGKVLFLVNQLLFGDFCDLPGGVSEEVLLLCLGERRAAGVVEEGLVSSIPMPDIHNE